jgi:hypothetical protein
LFIFVSKNRMHFFPVLLMRFAFLSATAMLSCISTAQTAPAKPVIFAVIDDGKIIEPIAVQSEGKWTPAIGGEQGSLELNEFALNYYTPKTSYHLITGGKINGKAIVVSNDPAAECSGAMATVTTSSAKVKLHRFEMALATNIRSSKPASGLRRSATTAEKTAIDKLAMATFRQHKAVIKGLKAVKLTVLDTDNDKLHEIVGTYTVSPSSKERGMLFFIAAKNKAGLYEIQYSEYSAVKETEVMSGDITHVDEGIYQEMLLDVLDTDNSGAAKIFTMKLSFEGVGYNAYQRNGNQWERVLEISNYHCGY